MTPNIVAQRALIFAALGLAALFNPRSASASNIVVNGGFEDDPMVGVTPTGYTQSGDLSFTGISIGAAHSGQAAYDFGGSQSQGFGFLTQALPTVAGQNYMLDYYLLIPGGSPAEFLVNVGGDASSGTLVGGATLMDLVNPPTSESDPSNFPSNYALETASFTAVSDSTNLNFGAYNNPSFFLLDDISVTPTPVPPSLALFASGLIGLGLIRRRRRVLSAA